MFASSKLRLFLCIATLVFAAASSRATPVYLQDNGAFFSDRAKAEAARNIAELESSVRKDLAVETFQELPADLKRGASPDDKAAMNRVLEQWAVQQARAKGINGVYILLVRVPSHLQVVVGNDTQKKAFTLRDRDALVSEMLVKLRAKQYDDALLDGVNFVSTTMRAHVTGQVRTGSLPVREVARGRQGIGGWLVPLLIGALVIWAVAGIFRAIFRGSGAGGGIGGGMPMGGGGGGGFFSSLLGGMFGAGAGMWLYDQFSGNRGNSAWGADRDDRSSVDPGYSGKDTDYSSSGDSFGDQSGGGDSGGDAGGGGDSGGGDF